jgi:ammonia channel protein AmtB
VAWSLAATWAILKAVDVVMGLRASEHEERVGLDLTGHRESAYTLLD